MQNQPLQPKQQDAQTGFIILLVSIVTIGIIFSTNGNRESNRDSSTPSTSVDAGTSRQEDEITRSRYAECVRQREAFGVDTSPCSQWAEER